MEKLEPKLTRYVSYARESTNRIVTLEKLARQTLRNARVKGARKRLIIFYFAATGGASRAPLTRLEAIAGETQVVC